MSEEIEIETIVRCDGRTFDNAEDARKWLKLLAWSRGYVREQYSLRNTESVDRRARMFALAIEANANVELDGASLSPVREVDNPVSAEAAA